MEYWAAVAVAAFLALLSGILGYLIRGHLQHREYLDVLDQLERREELAKKRIEQELAALAEREAEFDKLTWAEKMKRLEL